MVGVQFRSERRGLKRCFFFKQKTAYEVLRSLVGSEMCIRDSGDGERLFGCHRLVLADDDALAAEGAGEFGDGVGAVSYTHLTLPTIYSV